MSSGQSRRFPNTRPRSDFEKRCMCESQASSEIKIGVCAAMSQGSQVDDVDSDKGRFHSASAMGVMAMILLFPFFDDDDDDEAERRLFATRRR